MLSTLQKRRQQIVIELHPQHYIVVRSDTGIICQIALSDTGPQVSFPDQKSHDISLKDDLIKQGEPITVDVKRLFDAETNTIVELGDPVGLPVWRRERLGDPSQPISLAVYGETSDPIRKGESDPVVTDIVISYVVEPEQTKKRTAEISHELAKKHGMSVMSVAGIRANLKRGVYGDMDNLIQAEAKVRRAR